MLFAFQSTIFVRGALFFVRALPKSCWVLGRYSARPSSRSSSRPSSAKTAGVIAVPAEVSQRPAGHRRPLKKASEQAASRGIKDTLLYPTPFPGPFDILHITPRALSRLSSNFVKQAT